MSRVALGDGKKPNRSDGECGSRRLEAGQAICPHQREQEMWCREVGRAEAGQGVREETLLRGVACGEIRKLSVSYGVQLLR